MNYNDLLADIRDWYLNDEINAERMVFLAEQKFARDLRLDGGETTITITLNARTYDLPTDYVQTRSLTLDEVEEAPIDFMPLERLRESRAYILQGRPQAYSISGGKIWLAPEPTTDHNATFTYYAKFVPLSQTIQTNYLLNIAYDLYLYGALLHAGPYIKDTSNLPMFEKAYNDAIDSVRAQDIRAQYSGSSFRRIPSFSP